MRFVSLLCGSLMIAHAAHADKLAYYSPTPRYELEIRPQELILRTSGVTHVLKRNECNGGFIQNFINETREAFEKNPSARGTPRRAYAEWNGRRRLIVAGFKRSPFPRLPEYFLTLITRDRQQCR